MTRRRLRPDEIALWQKVVEKAERLHKDPLPDPDDPARPAPPRPDPAARRALAPFRVGSEGSKRPEVQDLKPSLTDRFAAAPVRMDRKAYTRMARGRMLPEARIDLHGMTLDRAHPALNRFILSAQASGKRLVLVITGKGKRKRKHDDGPIPVPRGVLRHQVPQWLSAPPLAQAVLQIAPAHVSHGGDGAYYVYLRRAR